MRNSVIAAAIAAIVIIGMFSASLYYDYRSEKSLIIGPKLTLSTIISSGNVTGNETVQVFSEMPSTVGEFSTTFGNGIDISNKNIYNNSAYVELLNATFPYSEKSVNLFLSPVFLTIADEWVSLLGGMQGTQTPSLDIYATLSTIDNGTLYVYSYYNNIPFNPFNVTVSEFNGSSDWFSNSSVNTGDYTTITFANLSLTANISFDMNSPSFVNSINISSPSMIPGTQLSVYGGGGGQTGTFYVPLWYKNITLPLPLVATHISLNDSNALSYIIDSAAFGKGSVSINLNSNTVSNSTSGTVTNQMSTDPSLNVSAIIYPDASPDVYPADTNINGKTVGSNYTTAMIAIDNATYELIHGDIIYVYDNAGGESAEYLGNYTTIQITAIDSANGFRMEGGYLPPAAYGVVDKLFNNNVSLGSLSPNEEILGSTIWTNSQGYSNAANVYSKIAKTLKIFSVSIGLGLAIEDAIAATNAADAGVSEGAVIAESAKLISATLAMSSDIISLYSSIDFISSGTLTGFGYGVTNYAIPLTSGSSFYLLDHESTQPITFTANGETYTYYAPSNFIDAY
ncbi:MAG: hypothetical protein ACP5TG_06060 [Thermoplasmata archaeon]